MRRSTRSIVEPRGLALALVLAAFAGWASPTSEAKQLFEEGERAYRLGYYRAALERYQAAYRLKPLPALLFDIGQCHRFLGDLESARTFFRDYLGQLPGKPPPLARRALAEVEAKLAAEQKSAPQAAPAALAEQHATQVEPVTEAASDAPLPESEPASESARLVPDALAQSAEAPPAFVEQTAGPAVVSRLGQLRVLVPLGGALLAGAAGTGLLISAQHHSDLLDGGDGAGPKVSALTIDRAQASALLNEGLTQQWVGIGLWVTAALLTTAAAVLAWVIDFPSDSGRTR